MTNEKYGVELDLLVEKFNTKMNKAQNDAKKFGASVEKALTPRQLEIKNEEFNKDIENAKKQAQSLQEDMKEYEKFGYQNSPFYDEMAKDLAEVTTKVERLTQEQKDFNAEQAKMNDGFDINKSSEKMSADFTKSMEKMSKKAQRFLLSMFSVRSIFALVSRASSTYLNHDIELASKFEAMWAGIGAMLAPIIEYIANLVLKLVGYLNVFVEALTGVNFIAKATEKSLDAMGDSGKEASKSLAGFDEITNLSSQSSSGTEVQNPFEYLNDVELNQNVVKTLQDLAFWLKENWDWIKAVGIALGVAFGAATIGGWIKNIGGLSTTLGGGAGLLGILQGIIGVGAIALTIYIVGSIMEDLEKIKGDMKTIRDINQDTLRESLEMTDDLEEIYLTMDTNNTAILQQNEWLNSLSLERLFAGEDLLLNLEDQITRSEEFRVKLEEMLETTELTVEEQYGMISALEGQLDVNKDLQKTLEENNMMSQEALETNEKYQSSIDSMVLKLLDAGIGWQDILDKTSLSESQLLRIYERTETPVPVDFQSNIGLLKYDIQNLVDGTYQIQISATFGSVSGLDTLRNSVSNVLSGMGVTVPSYDVGTNYVPNDQLAMVHKGEAIVPAKYNNSQTFGGNDNSSVVSKLDELIDALENKDMNAYISQKQVGEASSSYISAQSRIMGRSRI